MRCQKPSRLLILRWNFGLLSYFSARSILHTTGRTRRRTIPSNTGASVDRPANSTVVVRLHNNTVNLNRDHTANRNSSTAVANNQGSTVPHRDPTANRNNNMALPHRARASMVLLPALPDSTAADTAASLESTRFEKFPFFSLYSLCMV